MPRNRSITFFDDQFRACHEGKALELNPFEALALPFLHGDLLDFGCGLGNLAFAAAARGCTVTALDASQAAIAHVSSRAAASGARVSARQADLREHALDGDYDCIVAIGLLMYFDCATAARLLAELQARVRPGGVAVINVLVEGTTYLAMFDPAAHCLFTAQSLQEQFSGWQIERLEMADFDAPGGTLKRFCTVVARKPTREPGPQLPGPPQSRA